MALSYCVLASGSSGNCLWVRGGGTQILVDCGISAKLVARRLEEAGGRIEDIRAVVCTHGHSDHVGGAGVLTRRHDVDLYVAPKAQGMLPSGVPVERLKSLPYDGELRLEGLSVASVPTSHDAPQSVALRISDGESSLGVVTDLGVVTPSILKAFAGLDGIVLELNHDVPMLLNGPYPERLKKRIRGNWGHLSNEQGAELLAALLHDGLQQVTLGHISEHNNTPDLARAAAERILAARGGTGPRLAVARQRSVGEPVALSRAPTKALPAKARQQQLALRFR